jgi:hypothetical protein
LLTSQKPVAHTYVGIKDPLVPKLDTQETENLDKAISSDPKCASMYLFQQNRHMSTKWPTVAPPYIPDAVVPAPNPGFVQVKGSNLPSLAKRLGGWFRAMELYRNPEEEARTL